MNFDGIYGHRPQKARLELLAKRGNIPQTMLFTGPPGIGKRILARRFLEALFCYAGNPPCHACTSCAQIDKGIHPDYIELLPGEKGSIPVGTEGKNEPGSVRWLIDRLSRKSISGRRGVLIDGVDRISEEGQNALLKTVEEPAATTCVILTASGRAGVLPTITSRSFVIAFHPLPESETRDALSAMGIPPDIINLAAAASGGSPGTAHLLQDDAAWKPILDLCGEISAYLRDGGMPGLAIDKPLKLLGTEAFIDILTHIYRQNLIHLQGLHAPSDLKDLFIDDPQKIQGLIKILLALKRGLSNNLNIRIALKGMLYSLYSGEPAAVREARFDYSI